MSRMARGRKAVEADDVRTRDLDIGLRHGGELAEKRLERVPVDSPGASLEASRVDQVRSADARDVDAEAWVLADQCPSGARVVEVDVGQEQVTHVANGVAVRRQATTQRLETARRSAVDDREPVLRVDEIRGNQPL